MSASDSFPSELSASEEEEGPNPFGNQAKAGVEEEEEAPVVQKVAEYDDVKAAVLAEDLDALATCMKTGFDVESLGDDGKPVLFHAVDKHKLASVQSLLSTYKANAKSKDTKMQEITPLHLACQRGFTDAVTLLVDHGADVNGLDLRGKTPLHLAAVYSPASTVSYLVSQGATVNVSDNNSYTPLHSATNASRKEIVELFLDSNADVTTRNKSGLTPLEVAHKRNATDCIALLEAKEEALKQGDGTGAAAATTTNTPVSTEPAEESDAAHKEGTETTDATPPPAKKEEEAQPASNTSTTSSQRPQSARKPSEPQSKQSRPQSAAQRTAPAPFQEKSAPRDNSASSQNLNASQGTSENHATKLSDLKAKLKAAEKAEDYTLADSLHTQILQEKESERKRRQRHMLTRQASDVAVQRRKLNEAAANFDKDFGERRGALKKKHADTLSQLQSKHQADVKAYEGEREEALARSKPRPSAEVLRTRAMQSRYASNKQYAQAEKCKKDAEQMEIDEQKAHKDKWTKATKAKVTVMRRKYLSDRKIIEDKQASELSKFEAAGRKEKDRLLKEHAASQSHQNQKLAMERQKSVRTLENAPPPPPAPRRQTSADTLNSSRRSSRATRGRSQSQKNLSTLSAKPSVQESEDSGLPPGPEPQIEEDESMSSLSSDDASDVSHTAASNGGATDEQRTPKPEGQDSPVRPPQSDAVEDAPIPNEGTQPRKSVMIQDDPEIYDDLTQSTTSEEEEEDLRGAGANEPLPPPPPRMTSAEAQAILEQSEREKREALARKHEGVSLLGHLRTNSARTMPRASTNTSGHRDQAISDSANAVLAVVNMLSSQIGDQRGTDASSVAQMILQQVANANGGGAGSNPSSGGATAGIAMRDAQPPTATAPAPAASQPAAAQSADTTTNPRNRPQSAAPNMTSYRKSGGSANTTRPHTAVGGRRRERPATAVPSHARSASTPMSATTRGRQPQGAPPPRMKRPATASVTFKARPEWCSDTKTNIGRGSSANQWHQAGRLADPLPPSFRQHRPKSPYTKRIPTEVPIYRPKSPRRQPSPRRGESDGGGGQGDVENEPTMDTAVPASPPPEVDRHQGSIAPSTGSGSDFWLALIDDRVLAKTEKGDGRPFKTHLQHLRDSVLLEEKHREDSSAKPGAGNQNSPRTGKAGGKKKKRKPRPPSRSNAKGGGRNGTTGARRGGTGPRGMRGRRQQQQQQHSADGDGVVSGAPFVNDGEPVPGPKPKRKGGRKNVAPKVDTGAKKRPARQSPRQAKPPEDANGDGKTGNRYSYRALYNSIVSQENHSELHRNSSLIMPRNGTEYLEATGRLDVSQRMSPRDQARANKAELAASMREPLPSPRRQNRRRAAVLGAR